jgi:predicted RNA-binding protein YlqC (UPF0109 family)
MSDTPETDFILYVVQNLVNEPDAVKVSQKDDDLGTLVSLEVAPEDMGKIIGKSGQTAKSLRTLLRVVGSKYDKRVNLKILEPGGGEVRAPQEGADEAPADEAPVAAAPEAPADDLDIAA